jgi:hypothetical protein
VVGIVLLVLACAWVPILNKLVIIGAKQGAQLTKESEESWKDIPGHFDINLHNDHFFFHCLNADDVVYKGEKPMFEEYGPYIYREYDTYTNVKYDQDIPVPAKDDPEFKKRIDDAATAKGLTATFNNFMRYETEMEDDMDKTAQGVDTKLKVVN